MSRNALRISAKEIGRSVLLTVIIPALFIIAGCSTGIEGTKTIKMSGADRRALALSAEETFLKDIVTSPLSDWTVGKRFLVADNRAAYAYRTATLLQPGDSLQGKTFVYKGVTSRPTPGGRDNCVILFSCDGMDVSFDTGKSTPEARASLTGADMPMLVDLDLVDSASRLLTGRRLWTRNAIWYAPDGRRIDGRKYVPVTVTGVLPGDKVFPLKVCFRDDTGTDAWMLMNAGAAREDTRRMPGVHSRSFANLFSLTDPKEKYPGIRQEIWDYICRGELVKGMTKDECKLAIGNPKDVNSGHDWNNTLDIWTYSDGSFLRFMDGLLYDFRR